MKNNQQDLILNPDKSLNKKSFFRLALERFGLGGIASLIVAEVFINIFRPIPGESMTDVKTIFLLADVIVGLISMLIGGIGGLIFGGIWKNNKAAVIGGIVIGLIISALLVIGSQIVPPL